MARRCRPGRPLLLLLLLLRMRRPSLLPREVGSVTHYSLWGAGCGVVPSPPTTAGKSNLFVQEGGCQNGIIVVYLPAIVELLGDF